MGLRILLADGSIAAQHAGQKLLSAAGYEVIAVSNGMAADRQIGKQCPDIALLDVHMAGYTGMEVCQKAKASPETARMPVLLMVGKMEPFPTEGAAQVKADGIIVKPFEAGQLIALIEKLAQRAQQSAAAAPEAPVAETFSLPLPPKAPATQPVPIPRPSVSLPPLGGETCDVCGHLNLGAAFACQQCDVPLPSSVTAFRAAKKTPQPEAPSAGIGYPGSRGIGRIESA